MSTFGVMKTRLIDEMLRDDLTADQLGNAINDAIELQEGERYKFNEKRRTILTVAAQEYYSLAAPTLLDESGAALSIGELMLEIDDIFTSINNNPYRLTARTQQHMNEWQSTTYQGQPADYTVYGGELRIWPIPDQVYTLSLNGLVRLGPNPLSGDSNTNAWMTEGGGIIRGQAKLILYRDLLRDDEGVALATDQIVRAGGNPDPASAKRKMAAQAYTGRIKPWSL
jgi:hypothetical protein